MKKIYAFKDPQLDYHTFECSQKNMVLCFDSLITSLHIEKQFSYYTYRFRHFIPNNIWRGIGRFLLVVFSFSLYSISYSQDIHESVHYINYSINNGLPSAETYDVFQDSKGFLWVGTDNGVVRYDGSNFEVFTTKDGLTDNTIFKIQEDYQGRIWFMTYNRKLCYYENHEFVPYKFNDEFVEATKNLFLGNTITNFEIDTASNISIDFVDFYSFYISKDGLISRVQQPLLKINHIYNCPNILSVINLLEAIVFHDELIGKYIVNNHYLGKIHLFLSESKILVGSSSGLEYYDRKNKVLSKIILQENTITGLDYDFEGGLWCSSLANGIFYIPSPEISYYNVNSENFSHFNALIDQNDDPVFSYSTANYKLNIEKRKLQVHTEPISQLDIPLGKINRGVKFENPIYTLNFKKASSTCLRIDSLRTIIACNKKGLFMLEDSSILDFHKINHDEQKVIKSKDYLNRWWNFYPELRINQLESNPLLTNRLLPHFKPKTLKFFKALNNQIWIGTIDGLYLFDEKKEMAIKADTLPYQFVNYRIQDIEQTKDSTLIFATKVNGLFLWKNDTVISLTKNKGLPSNTIYQIVYDSLHNEIWLTTNKGIVKLILNANNEWVPISVISKYNGLKSTDIRQFSFYKNNLVFANNNGVNQIPKSAIEHNFPPKLYVLTTQINNTPEKLVDLNSLSYSQNNININYQGISYKSLNDLKYKYKLDPLNKNWRITKNSSLNFNTLPPGEYTFSIKAINVDGIESDQKTIKFNIIPAFWMTIWFKATAILFAILLGYWVSIKSIRNYKSKAELQRNLNELQAISLQSKMNPHFIFNSLNSIQNYILKNEKENANDYLIEFSRLIRIILDNSNSATIPLQRELETLDIYVKLEKKRLRQTFEYVEIIDENIDIKNCLIPTLLIQPYIENSIWHGKVYDQKEGFIQLKIKKEGELLRFEILDNGIGIKQAEASKIKSSHISVASSITKKRVTLLGLLNDKLSEVVITEAFKPNNKQLNVGTLVSFTIPYTLKKS